MAKKPTAPKLVLFSARLPAETVNALKLAAANRAVNGRKPYTRQEIAAEALREWLRREGHLK